MPLSVVHTKVLVAPDSGPEDKVYGVDYVDPASHSITGDSLTLDGFNDLTLASSTTGNPVTITASGGDADVGITLVTKGAGILTFETNSTDSIGAFFYGQQHLNATTIDLDNVFGYSINTILDGAHDYTAGFGPSCNAGNYVNAWGPGTVSHMVNYGYWTNVYGPVTRSNEIYIGTPIVSGGTIADREAIWIADQNVAGITNAYSFWYDSPGVYRIKGDGVMAYYNPSFTKYTPGAANFERVVQQWNSDVLEYGPEAGGTGVLRAMKLLGASVTCAGDLSVPDEAYDATAWNGSLEVPTKNAIRDKIETLGTAAYTSSGAYDAAGAAAAALVSALAADISLSAANVWAGVQQFGTIGGAVGKLVLAGSTSGSSILNASAAAGTTTLTLPAVTDTVAVKGANTFTGVQSFAVGAFNALSLVFAGDTAGWYRSGSNQWAWGDSGTPRLALIAGTVRMDVGTSFGWCSGNATTSADAVMTRTAVASFNFGGSANGQLTGQKTLSELLTIAAAATSTTTIQIPAGAAVEFVTVRVTVAITCTSTFDVGDGTTANKFNFAGVSKAATTTDKGGKGFGAAYAAATSIVITPDTTPSDATGRVRVTIHYRDATPATS